MMATEYTEAEKKFMDRLTYRGPLPTTKPAESTVHPLAGRTPGVRSTSRQAFKSIQKELSDKQREVYVAIQMSKRPVCDLELVAYLGWSVSSVTARRNELMEVGKIEEAFRAINPKTNRRCIYWKATV